jgi:hypothetical protein
MGFLVVLILFVATVALSSILNGWALSILWEWFMVPVFALPSLTIPTAIGISLVVSYLTHHYVDTDKDEENAAKVGMYAFLKPVVVLAIGWVVKQFMG